MSDLTWGLPETRKAARPAPERTRTGLSPKVAASAHNGIVWLHLSALALWVGIAAVLGVVAATGRDIPAVVFVACLAAAGGHALFLALHSLFATAARRRQASQPPAGA